MKTATNTILEKIANSDIFLVVGTNNYLRELCSPNSEMLIQVKLAKIFRKPVIILIHTKMSDREKIELEEFFVGHNVIKEIEFNSTKEMAQLIRTALVEVLHAERQRAMERKK